MVKGNVIEPEYREAIVDPADRTCCGKERSS